MFVGDLCSIWGNESGRRRREGGEGVVGGGGRGGGGRGDTVINMKQATKI